MIFTQRESLAYSTNYALWLAGSVTKRDVQISRAILAQRLNVIDIENETMGSRLEPALLNALKASDDLIDQSGDGYITPKRAEEIKTQAEAIIAQILSESRALVVAYQQQLDQLLLNIVSDRKLDAERNLFLLIFLIILTTIFLIWITRSTLHQFDIAKEILKLEIAELEAARADLRIAQTTVKSLEDLNDSKNDFISTVNHELRTPLTAIRGFAELYRQGAVTGEEETKQLLARIEGESIRMGSLVEDLLLLARLDQAREMERLPVDIAKVTRDAIASAQVAGPGHPISLTGDVDELYTLGDQHRIHQVVANLLANARTHTPAGTAIAVSIAQSSDGVRIAVSDSGPGLSDEDQRRIFERFYRADSSRVRNDGEGSGLGLSIVDAVMRAHGGSVSVESTPGEGATFTLLFPGTE